MELQGFPLVWVWYLSIGECFTRIWKLQKIEETEKRDQQKWKVVEEAKKEMSCNCLHWHQHIFKLASNTNNYLASNLVDSRRRTPENSREKDRHGDWEHASIHFKVDQSWPKLTRLMVKAHDDVVSDRSTADVHLETHVSMQWPYNCTLACSVQVQEHKRISFEHRHDNDLRVNLLLLLRSILFSCVGGSFAFSVVRKLAKGPVGSVPV